MKNFFQWLQESVTGNTKFGLYPLQYGNTAKYPVGYFLPSAADALYYLDVEDRKYKGQEGPPFSILHLKCDFDCNELPTYKLPSDTSQSAKTDLPPDTSTHEKRFLP